MSDHLGFCEHGKARPAPCFACKDERIEELEAQIATHHAYVEAHINQGVKLQQERDEARRMFVKLVDALPYATQAHDLMQSEIDKADEWREDQR